MPTETVQRGIRRSEIKVLIKLYPVFRHYLKDRKSARGSQAEEWDPIREKHGRKAVDTFIELGPTYIKLGQIISSRPDLLPKEYLASFQDLQDNVPPAPFNEVEETIKADLGERYQELKNFNIKAISGASLGQVYLAEYNGRKVAVKVTRPRIEEIVKRDLIIIKRLIRLGRNRMDRFLFLSIDNVIADFSSRVLDEADYRKEASNIDRIKRNIQDRENVIIPQIFPEVSSKHVLTMEYIPGIKITDVEKLRSAGIDMKSLAFHLDLLFLRMLLRDDIFHADPHPGNVSVSDDGRLILYDFGMVGSLDKKTRFDLLSLYMGLLNSDPDIIIDSLLDMNALSPAANRGVIRRTIELSIAGMRGVNPEEREIREILEVANNVIFEFPFRLPRSLVLYMRMSSLLEGICRQLDPDFRFIRVLSQILYREGMLNELYSYQLSMFAKKALVSLEKGLDVLPLLKRRLDEQDSNHVAKKDYRIPGSVFLGFILLGAIYLAHSDPILGYPSIIADLIAFIVLMIKG
ncbi:MAG: AarF/ABC1/UbiB kinase family protein [Thermoplasmataceae archaeon]|jgi:predicted unusual protein kinase regulating ubiquinone biosynthesis (AarF/ABC1/UbiB family)